MSYLLDTHAVLWALTEPRRLGHGALEVVRDNGADLVVSAVSGWEIATKNRLGKLPQADALLTTWPAHLRHLSVRSLPITDTHALMAGGLDWDHRDPFDRMLAAQGMAESMTLITSDQVFTHLPGVRTLW